MTTSRDLKLAENQPPYFLESDDKFFHPVFGVHSGWGKATYEVETLSAARIPVEPVKAERNIYVSGPECDWIITDKRHGSVQALWIKPEPSTRVTGYVLKTGESGPFPASLTVEKYRILDHEEIDLDNFYDPVTVDETREPVRYDLSGQRPIPGQLSTAPGRYEIDKVSVLTYGLRYGSALPGVLTDMGGELERELKERFPGSDLYTHKTPWSMYLKTEYDVPVFRTKERYGSSGRRLKGTDRVRDIVTVNVDFRPHTSFIGANKDDAYASYCKYRDELIEWLESYRPIACSHCKGHGYVTEPGAKPTI